MRLDIPHALGRDEVRRRIAARIGDAPGKAAQLAGGPVALELAWTGSDTLSVEAAAMGYTVPATLTITDTALVFDIVLAPGMGFARRMIEAMIRERGEKLLA